MDNVTVQCGCGRAMRPVGTAPRGTYACGCGHRATVTVADRLQVPHCGYPGLLCMQGIVKEATALGLPLCGPHLAVVTDRLEEAVQSRLARQFRELELIAIRLEAARQTWDESLSGQEVRRAVRVADAASDELDGWYVYYMRFGENIKIGTTRNLRRRVNTLIPDELLAVEPGTRSVERERHRKFAHLRLGERGERFRPGADLLAHIAGVREAYGDPAVRKLPPAMRIPMPTELTAVGLNRAVLA